MNQQAEFRKLVRRISECSRELLPPSSPTGSYGVGDNYRILAFRLFSHAEIEAFLEDCAQAIVDHMSLAQEKAAIPNRYKAHIILHKSMRDHYPPISLNYRPDAKDGQRIKSFLVDHASLIQGNNGATEKDVIKLFSPLGFDLNFFDLSWLESMRVLGVRRGEVAHRSVTYSTTIQSTPEDERRYLAEPLWGLRRLAQEADNIIASIRIDNP